MYVLRVKPPFHVVKQYVERKSNGYRDIKIYLLKTRIYVMEFKYVVLTMEVMKA
ncbi:hypothetical protein LguiA_003806 [Lonicera macranthoides]